MIKAKILAALISIASVSACNTVETTRANPVELPPQSIGQIVQHEWVVQDVRVIVPTSLLASEADVFLPAADIVWREDPLGNRHEQVQIILDDAVTRGISHMDGKRAVFVDVQLRGWHALSDKARHTVGGKHDIEFDLIVRDATTSANLIKPERITMSFKAHGGFSALKAVRAGQTQKVRISAHIAHIINLRFGGWGETDVTVENHADAPFVQSI